VRSLVFFAFLLAGERIQFDEQLRPQFTAGQISGSAAATRSGMERWGATERGRALIRKFDTHECEVIVSEEPVENGSGKAPQPGAATLLGMGKTKTFTLILNPTFKPPIEVERVSHDEPYTPAEVMSAAWAAEMLHIDFYSRGISLPHHGRADFQKEWREVAIELGFPNLTHGDESEKRAPRVIIWRRSQ
jgi:hypothetical protein